MGGLIQNELQLIMNRAEKLPTEIIWALISDKLVKLPSLQQAKLEASEAYICLARYLVVREIPKTVSTKGCCESTSRLRAINSGMVIMKRMMNMKTYSEMGNPHGYDLISSWLEYGQPSETERISVFVEGLTNQRKLKIQSIPLEKFRGSKVPTPTKHLYKTKILFFRNLLINS